MEHPSNFHNNSPSQDPENIAEYEDLRIELRHRVLNKQGRVAVAAYWTGGPPAEDGDPEEEALAIAAGDIFSDAGRNRIQKSLCESLTSDLVSLGLSFEYAFWSDLELIARKVWGETANGEGELA